MGRTGGQSLMNRMIRRSAAHINGNGRYPTGRPFHRTPGSARLRHWQPIAVRFWSVTRREGKVADGVRRPRRRRPATGLTRQGSRKTRGSPGLHPRGPSCRASRHPACMPRCRSAPPARPLETGRMRNGRQHARPPLGACCRVPRRRQAGSRLPLRSRRCKHLVWPWSRWLETGRSLGSYSILLASLSRYTVVSSGSSAVSQARSNDWM